MAFCKSNDKCLISNTSVMYNERSYEVNVILADL